jgi:hypothetical protein
VDIADVLTQYGGTARPVLPELKRLETDFAKMKPLRDKLKEVMTAIEEDNNPPKLTRLLDDGDGKVK